MMDAERKRRKANRRSQSGAIEPKGEHDSSRAGFSFIIHRSSFIIGL